MTVERLSLLLIMSQDVLQRLFEEFCRTHPLEEVQGLLQSWDSSISSRHKSASPSAQLLGAAQPVLSPSPPITSDRTDLNALEPPTFTDGYSTLFVGSAFTAPNQREIFRGSVQTQSFDTYEDLVTLGDINGTPRSLSDTQTPYIMQAFTEYNMKEIGQDLESFFQDQLNNLIHNFEAAHYLIIATHSSNHREVLGLPSPALQPGARLLSTKRHYPGVHSSYTYVSNGLSAFALHVEDFYLKSANLVHAGAPKLWIVVHPLHQNRLEAHLASYLSLSAACSQFIRHSSVLLAPSLLHRWNIKFSIVVQKPGTIMFVAPNAYHYGLNLGPNIAEAINYCESDWIVPPVYRECSRRRGCGAMEAMTVASMKVEEFRPLDIPNFEDSPSVHPSDADPSNPPASRLRKKRTDSCVPLVGGQR